MKPSQRLIINDESRLEGRAVDTLLPTPISADSVASDFSNVRYQQTSPTMKHYRSLIEKASDEILRDVFWWCLTYTDVEKGQLAIIRHVCRRWRRIALSEEAYISDSRK
jgi:hypothetical protein